MKKSKKNSEIEERVENEIIVDCYNPGEQAMGWYSYLEDTLEFPFKAQCIEEREVSPLAIKEEVEVTEMANAEECEHEMFVLIKMEKKKKGLAVPLSQLKVLKGSKKTIQGVGDWHYWVSQGYEL